MKPTFDTEELKETLTPQQYAICVMGQTETPGSGEYFNHDETGNYACVVCDTALFSSNTKYHSTMAWPSFWQPIDENLIELFEDNSHGMHRTEVRCATCGAHLGHLFDDGPKPTGQHFCINSGALQFQAE